MNNLGDRLYSLRKSNSLTQEAFAAALNERYDLKINKSMVSKWENNIDTPSLNSAKYIAIFFDVSLDYLLGVSDDKQVAKTHMNIGEIIKVFRKKNKMTMQEFADRAGLSKGYISMLERSQHPQSQRKLVPSFETYQKVANAMSMSTDELVALLDDNETVRLNESSSSSSDATDSPFVGMIYLTDEEEWLIETFRSSNKSQQARLLAYLDGLLDGKETAKGEANSSPED